MDLRFRFAVMFMVFFSLLLICDCRKRADFSAADFPAAGFAAADFSAADFPAAGFAAAGFAAADFSAADFSAAGFAAADFSAAGFADAGFADAGFAAAGFADADLPLTPHAQYRSTAPSVLRVLLPEATPAPKPPSKDRPPPTFLAPDRCLALAPLSAVR